MPLHALTRELVEEIARQYPALQSLNLSANALRDVAHLELLPSLLRIDLSGNRLQEVPSPSALGACAAHLEFLDLSANAIESLTHVDACASLRVLDLGDNRIELFSELRHLQPLAHLEALTLQGNPIAAHATYRREVLSALPQLRSLDDADVTPAERLYVRVHRRAELHGSESPALLPSLIEPQIATSTGERASVAVADAAVSPVSSASLLTPDRVHRQQHERLGAQRFDSDTRNSSSADRERSRSESLAVNGVNSLRVDVAAGALTPTRRRPAASDATSGLHAVPRQHHTLDHAASSRSAAAAETAAMVPSATKKRTAAAVSIPVDGVAPDEQTRLLQSRVHALETILAIQDDTMQRALVSVGNARAASDAVSIEDAANTYTQLLATWRTQVVALMVQLASFELARSDDARNFERRALEVEGARAQLEHDCELWKQKLVNAEAQRDLERVRWHEAQTRVSTADAKAVSAVRTLALEREKLEHVAAAVAFFSARDGMMVGKMESLYAVARRLEAFERRLHAMRERVQTAASLLAHREARLRNSEAAIDAERRIWRHQLETLQRLEPSVTGTGDDAKARLRKSGGGVVHRFLRPATEAAFRALFHRLDPYDTGLVRAPLLLEALQVDAGVQRTVGGSAKLAKLAHHLELGIRARSAHGTVGGTITWGELLLLFMPASSGSEDASRLDECWGADDHDVGGKTVDSVRALQDTDGTALPPPFESHSGQAPAVPPSQPPLPSASQRRLERKTLLAMTRDELAQQVMALQDDRNELRRRVLDDARALQQRAASIRREWSDKVEQLVATTSALQRELTQQQSTTQRLTQELEATERSHGEAQHQLESLRRELLTQQSDFARSTDAMAAQHRDALQHEQEIWQKELQDVNFSHAVARAETQKHELRIRQLERELAKRNDALVANETQRVAHLEDKVQKRDAEIAKLRRERNTLLGTLREHERKLALQRPAVTESTATQTDAAPRRPEMRSAKCQTAARHTSALAQSTDMRMSIDEIADAPPSPQVDAVNTKRSSSDAQLPQDEISRRLRQLQSLTESLLDDD